MSSGSASAAAPPPPQEPTVSIDGEEVVTVQPPAISKEEVEELTNVYENCRLKIGELTTEQYKAANQAEVLAETALKLVKRQRVCNYQVNTVAFKMIEKLNATKNTMERLHKHEMNHLQDVHAENIEKAVQQARGEVQRDLQGQAELR